MIFTGYLRTGTDDCVDQIYYCPVFIGLKERARLFVLLWTNQWNSKHFGAGMESRFEKPNSRRELTKSRILWFSTHRSHTFLLVWIRLYSALLIFHLSIRNAVDEIFMPPKTTTTAMTANELFYDV